MALGREASLGVGLATAALVWGIYNSALPTVADVRVGAPGDGDIDATERTATWTAAAAVAGVSVISRDPTVFVLGGTMVVALAFWHRHANHNNPMVGGGSMPSSRQVAAELNAAGAGTSPSA